MVSMAWHGGEAETSILAEAGKKAGGKVREQHDLTPGGGVGGGNRMRGDTVHIRIAIPLCARGSRGEEAHVHHCSGFGGVVGEAGTGSTLRIHQVLTAGKMPENPSKITRKARPGAGVNTALLPVLLGAAA